MTDISLANADAPAILALDDLLQRAISNHASDVHLESTPNHLQVRFRIDGLLTSISSLERAVGIYVIARIKVLASLNVAECRYPQDGKLLVTFFERHFDVRVATFPTVHGEKVVLRLLERSYKNHSFEHLAFDEKLTTQIQAIAQRAQGFFLVTGPTGSGKTTTLHALLSSIKKPEISIYTLEDPVEYMIEGITQTSIAHERGFTFAAGLRSLLRADPDVIMVGEIRDHETAQVALQASLTGHFVASTLHTTDAPSVLIRLLDMAIEPFLIQAGLTAILAQRLVRKLCTHCRFITRPTQEEIHCIKQLDLKIEMLSKSTGCAQCLHTGYTGRAGIFQLLVLTDTLRKMLTQRPEYGLLSRQAIKEGMKPLIQAAAEKIKNGETSLAEVMRVLG